MMANVDPPEMIDNVALRRKQTSQSYTTIRKLLLLLAIAQFLVQFTGIEQVQAGPALIKVCDTREIKSVTSRVCSIYKRSKNSRIRMDRQGNLRIARGTKGGAYSSSSLAVQCCKTGCPAHIFAYNC